MTPAQTQPGADLDAQVARMLGWTAITDLGWSLRGVTPSGGEQDDVPEFSTTWDGAGLVVEHMRKLGCNYNLEGDANEHRVNFFDRSGLRGKASHASAPACICIAALAATGGEG